MPYQDKVRISHKVKSLSKEKLGELVQMIKENAPRAYKDNDKETCHIFVDNIPKSFFIKMAKYSPLTSFIDESATGEEEFLQKRQKIF